MTLILIVAMTVVYPRKYSKALDRFTAPGLPEVAGVAVLVVPAAILAAAFHPSLNNNWFTDTAWAFALYLEAIAIYPQLHIFYSAPPGGEAVPEPEVFEVNFVFSLAIGRLCHFVFWLSSYQELNDRASDMLGKKFPGHLVVLSQVRKERGRGEQTSSDGMDFSNTPSPPPHPPQIVNILLLCDFMYYHISFARSGSAFNRALLPQVV